MKGGDDELILSARAAGQPIFSMKTASHASLVKALRSLAGIDPSPLSLRDASAVVRHLLALSFLRQSSGCHALGSCMHMHRKACHKGHAAVVVPAPMMPLLLGGKHLPPLLRYW